MPRVRSRENNATSDRSHLIPRPKGRIQLRPVLGFADDLSNYKEFLQEVRSIAQCYLDMNKLMSEQDEKQWNIFVQKLCERFHGCRRFEGAWPIRVYLCRYLQCRRQTKTNRLQGCEQQGDPEDTDQTDEFEMLSQSPTNESVASSSRCIRHQRGLSSKFGPSTPTSSTSSTTSTESEPVVSDADSNFTPSSRRDTSNPVKAFLSSLNPNIDNVWPVFREYGVRTESHLKGFATWPEEDRNAVLKSLLVEKKLTRLEHDVLRFRFAKGDVAER